MLISARYRRELDDRWLAMRLAMRGRVHQYPEILALRRFLTRFAVDCVLDVGANVGQYATMLRSDCRFRGTILSFEPNPAVFADLKARARGDARWHVFNLALSDRDGTAPFHLTHSTQLGSLNVPLQGEASLLPDHSHSQGTVDVETRRLDGMWAGLRREHGISNALLKMDTQGHDRSVCVGAGAVLGAMSGIQTEMAVRPLYEGATDYRAMTELLAEAGFVPSAFFANNKGHFPLLVEMDGLFVRADLTDGLDLG